MRVIFTAPEKSAYHDNTTWIWIPTPLNQGFWLHAGEQLAIISPEKKEKEFTMHANKARELTKQARIVDLTEIFHLIELAAKRGENILNLDLARAHQYQRFADEIKKQLEDQGYEVDRRQGSDQREGTSWDSLIISWK